MDLNKLYSLQKKLDEKINENHNLNNQDLLTKKILALSVEVAELANETRCFKFWSIKNSSPKNIILEEFVDCLHFILSIGIDLKYYDISFEDIKINDVYDEKDMSYCFLDLMNSINNFRKSLCKSNYLNVFINFISLGNKLGLDRYEIEDAYLKKNSINHARQKEGY
ncbi:dUTP diphosphatase [Alkalithermobacter paradoxus]|uniref:dUTPase n=1 Tax=Alkalithermobacter paradoxus TaxID=29349 RepID=A0A1V4IAR6_9FIRM|nr:dUTPase [[Clostridium] thermoalcaliphilum]